MSSDELKIGACNLGRAIEEGSIDPVELTEQFFSAIDEHPFATSIYVRLTKKRARAEAKSARHRARSGLRRSVLDGVPISWKDVFDTAGEPTESGSKILHNRIPDRDAEVLRRATLLGTICLGKTHQSELAFSGLGLNPMTATHPCINDHDAVSGGSSSGAAASVAFHLAAAAVGSDTGGSVRIPAAWNDLVGLKTTHGVLPIEGVVPLCPKFDTVGPLAASVEDATALYAIMSGRSQRPSLEGDTVKGKRFLIIDEGLNQINSQPLKAFRRATETLGQAGATLEVNSMAALVRAQSLAACLYCVEAYGHWKDSIEAHGHLMFAPIRERFETGLRYSGVDYVTAWQELVQIRSEYLAAIDGFDAVLIPTCLVMPPKTSALLADAKFYAQQNLLTLTNTRIGNLMEVPALTLPSGTPSAGLMVLGRPREEMRLLRLGRAIERVMLDR